MKLLALEGGMVLAALARSCGASGKVGIILEQSNWILGKSGQSTYLH